jgi:hypothetical protein
MENSGKFIKWSFQTINVIFVIYGIGVMIAATYFEFIFAKQNGFIAWLLLGWIMPFILALAWPYYLIVYLFF